MFLQTFFVWAVLSGAVFPLSLFAQEEVEKPPIESQAPKKPIVDWSRMEILRGAQVKPHVIPTWFSRRAPEFESKHSDTDLFVINLPHVSGSIGRGPKIGPQYACKRSNGTWVFCD